MRTSGTGRDRLDGGTSVTRRRTRVRGTRGGRIGRTAGAPPRELPKVAARERMDGLTIGRQASGRTCPGVEDDQQGAAQAVPERPTLTRRPPPQGLAQHLDARQDAPVPRCPAERALVLR